MSWKKHAQFIFNRIHNENKKQVVLRKLFYGESRADKLYIDVRGQLHRQNAYSGTVTLPGNCRPFGSEHLAWSHQSITWTNFFLPC